MPAIIRRAGGDVLRLIDQLTDQWDVYTDTGGTLFIAKIGTPIVYRVALYPTLYVAGLNLTWLTAATLEIGMGACRSSDDSFDMDVSVTPLSIDITVVGAGGRDTGVELPDTWYSVWVIGDSNTVSPLAGILHAGAGTPVMPAGYDQQRRIGYVRNNSASNLLKFFQSGYGPTKEYTWDVEPANLQVLANGSAVAFTNVDLSALMPPTSRRASLLWGFANDGGAVGDVLTLRPDGAVATGPQSFRAGVAGIAAANKTQGFTQMPVSSAQIVEYLVSNVADDADLFVLGFEDDLAA